MYIQIANDGDKLVLMSRKLFRAMGFAPGRHPWFVQLARIKGTDEFVIVRRENADTFRTQCSMVTPTHKRKTPAAFGWTVPSLEYFLAVTGTEIITTKILRVKPATVNGRTYFRICTR